MEKYYGDLIESDFRKEIDRMKEQKLVQGYKNLEYTFIFVNANNCSCIIVEENELYKKEITNDRFTNIVVLLKYKTYHLGYFNHHYWFIGIFDNRFKKDCIKFRSIGINTFEIHSGGCYNTRYITNFSIEFLINPFEKYINNAQKPIKKAIGINMPKKWAFIDNNNFSVKMGLCSYDISSFEDFLNDVQALDENITRNLSFRKFNPGDYSD